MTHDPRTSCRPTRGFTLLELILVLVVTMIVVGGLTSSVMVATASIPDIDDPVVRKTELAPTFMDIHEDLAAAMHVVARSSEDVTIILADRDGDGRPQSIRYAWSGTPGDPVTRTEDGGAAQTIVSAADHFAIDLQETIVTETHAFGGGEVVTPSVAAEQRTTAGFTNAEILQDNWFCHTVPSPDPDTVSDWRLTTVEVYGRARRASGELLVEVYLADASGLPTGDVLTTAEYQSGDLGGGWNWRANTFADSPWIKPGQNLAVVFSMTSGGDRFETNTNTSDLGHRFHEYDGDTKSWNYRPGEMLICSIGQETRVGGATPLERTRYDAATVEVTMPDQQTYIMDARLVNEPEKLDNYWELTFDAAPTDYDLDQDGTADWTMPWPGYDPFDTAIYMPDGQWHVHSGLKTNPNVWLQAPTAIDVRLRDTIVGTPAGFTLRVDHDGSTAGVIIVEIERLLGVQEIRVEAQLAAGGTDAWLAIPLTLGVYHDVRLVVEPDLDKVAVYVNGVEEGVFDYERVGSSTSYGLRFYETIALSGVQIDHIRIREGGDFD